MTLGENIKANRKNKGLTQKALGELSGIAEPTIRKYESGRLNPKIETVDKIAKALDMSIFDLVYFQSREEIQEEILSQLEFDETLEEISLAADIGDTNMTIKGHLKLLCGAAGLPYEAINELTLFVNFMKYKYNERKE